jgi:hypothetical protein
MASAIHTQNVHIGMKTEREVSDFSVEKKYTETEEFCGTGNGNS